MPLPMSLPMAAPLGHPEVEGDQEGLALPRDLAVLVGAKNTRIYRQKDFSGLSF